MGLNFDTPWGAAASAADSTIAGMMGLGGMLIGGKMSKGQAKYQARLNYKYARRYAENSPSWIVHGYRRAHINPILAAQHGQLSVSDNPTALNSIQSSAPAIDIGRPISKALEMTSAKQDIAIGEERKKQERIHTDAMLSDLERQRGSDLLESLYNAAKADEILRGIPTDDMGRPVIGVTHAAPSDDRPPIGSVYGQFDSLGRRSPVGLTDGERRLRKGASDLMDLAAEKYIRDTISLGTGSAKDLGAAVSDIVPQLRAAKSLGNVLKGSKAPKSRPKARPKSRPKPKKRK